MIRLIIRHDDCEAAAHVGGPVMTRYRTFDVALPEVEAFLRGGGRGQGAFDYRTLVGAELIEEEPSHG